MPDQPYPYQQFGGQFPPPPAPRKKRHVGRWIAGAALAVVVAVAATAASGPGKHAATTDTPTSAAPVVAQPSTSVAPTTPQAPEPAVPDPAGAVTGTCAYELSSDLDNYETHAGDLNAEVDVENTGNIGIVLTVTVSYPQLGHTPISMSKTVEVPTGQTVTVPFTKPVGQSQITRLQDWQSGHDYDDGCIYKGTITDTYGTAH